MSPPIVLCIGNSFRRDDGSGPAVGDALRERRARSVAVVDLDGEPARVVELWDDADLAVVVDAARSGQAAGTVERREVGVRSGAIVPAARAASTHGWSLGDALELGRSIDRLPRRLVVFTIEGADFAMGPGLTAAVGDAVATVARRVVDELDRNDDQTAAGVV